MTLVNKQEKDDNYLRYQFDHTLLEIRESLHRRSRFSSRNEALEEVCKLLHAQIKLVQKKQNSLNSYAGKIASKDDAEKLISIINTTILESIPEDMRTTLVIDEFLLSIQCNEYKLLNELCIAFNNVDWNMVNDIILLDLFNEIFGKFLSDSFNEEKQLGQYLTPIEIVRMMVKIALSNLNDEDLDTLMHPIQCKEFGYILDPSCGVGSFLVEVIHQLLPEVIQRYGEEAANEWLKNMGTSVLFGIDKSTRMLKMAITHFAVMGVECKNLYSINSLDNFEHKPITEQLNNGVKLILSNPPFGAEFKGKDLEAYKIFSHWSSRVPRKIDSEILFVEKYIDWLQEGGNCLAILPDSILTNRGIFEDLRKGISDKIKLEKVISLPPETFAAAGTTAKTSIVDFIKAPVSKNYEKNVYFSICKNIGFKVFTKGSHKQKISTSKNDIPFILSDCLENKNISHGRYILFSNNSIRWDATYHASLPESILKRISVSYDKLTVADVAMLVNNRVDPKSLDGNFRYIEISNVDINSCTVSSKVIPCKDAPSRARKVVQYGDVLVSTVRPEQKKIGVVINEIDNNAICTTGFAVLRPIKIAPLLLCQLLKSDFVTAQLMRNNIGVAYPTIDENCLADIVLPITDLQIQDLNQKAEQLMQQQLKLNESRQAFALLLNENVNSWFQESL